MPTRTPGRHRADTRPTTPLTILVESVAANATTVTRRSAVVAASSGLVVTMGLPAAFAAPVTDEQAPSEQTAQTPDVVAPQAPTADAEDTGTITVPADAKVNLAATVVTAATPPPPPPPAPTQRAERADAERSGSARASRSTRQATAERSGSAEKSSTAKSAQKATPAPSAKGGSVLAIAERYVGTMYRYGGTTPEGFDCSGFTQYVYAQVGIKLPRTSAAQAQAGKRISASEARPGDLVYTPGHIGIYAGGNMMYDSPRSGKAVAKRKMWFTPTFIRVG